MIFQAVEMTTSVLIGAISGDDRLTSAIALFKSVLRRWLSWNCLKRQNQRLRIGRGGDDIVIEKSEALL